MTKRGNNEGVIFQRKDGRWVGQVTLPSGPTRYKVVYGKRKSDVIKKVDEIKHALVIGLAAPGERQTVSQYFADWLEIVKSQIRPSTLRRYTDSAHHINRSLGKIKLSKLTAQQVQNFYAEKINDGLSSTTVHHIHGVLHRSLKDALRLGLVPFNVSERVNVPRRRHVEMKTLTENEARAFLEAASGDRFEALYVLALTTGMRQGELLALRWGDLNLERGTLTVRMNVQEAGGSYILAEPKTAYSKRTIGLSVPAIEALREHALRQEKERMIVGQAWNAALDLVFPNQIGGLMIPDNLAKRGFKRLLARAGLPDMRFHDLRHTAATLLLARGVMPKTVSMMLGHADISITLRVYAHVTPHMNQAAADVMSNLFGKGNKMSKTKGCQHGDYRVETSESGGKVVTCGRCGDAADIAASLLKQRGAIHKIASEKFGPGTARQVTDLLLPEKSR